MSTEHNTETTLGQRGVGFPRIPVLAIRLHSGDRMSRKEFHRLYEEMPEDFKAELIGGIVYVASPVSLSHGQPHLVLGAVVIGYQARTPGVDASDNTTVMLGDEEEPQPDLFVRILPEYGGQSSTTKEGYVEGAPELVVEVAYSSQAIDLHGKKDDYARHGVAEYLVVCVNEQQLRWFDLAAGKELQSDASGVYRMQTFPGLWINGPGILAHDYSQLMTTLEQGLSTPEHAAFVAELEKRRAELAK